MNKYNIIGAIIIFLIFFGMVAVMAQSMGWMPAIIGFGFSVLLTALIGFACYLLTK